jgi:hypothetical protein
MLRINDEELEGIIVSARDLRLLRDLYECRLMTLSQIATLHFAERAPAAKVRVQKLKRAELLTAYRKHVSDPAVHYLTRKGLELLLDRGCLHQYPKLSREQMERRSQVSEATRLHELQVMDVKCAFYKALRNQQNLEIAQFSTWPMLHRFQAVRPDGQKTTVNPDGFVQLRGASPIDTRTLSSFFLEVDRGSEVQETLAMRAYCYRDYFRAGGFAVRHGLPVEKFKELPFRVLFVFQTAERRNNAAERMLLLHDPIGSHSCLTTFEEVARDPFGKIWVTPRDYLVATQNTPYELARRRNTAGYNRSAERERFVGEQILKHSILH